MFDFYLRASLESNAAVDKNGSQVLEHDDLETLVIFVKLEQRLSHVTRAASLLNWFSKFSQSSEALRNVV